jgi:hypothetical protein
MSPSLESFMWVTAGDDWVREKMDKPTIGQLRRPFPPISIPPGLSTLSGPSSLRNPFANPSSSLSPARLTSLAHSTSSSWALSNNL